MQNNKNQTTEVMSGGVAAFLGIALLSALANQQGLAAMAVNIAWILFLFRLVFAAVFSLLEESPQQRARSQDITR